MRSLLIKNEHLQRKCYVSIRKILKNHMHSHNLSAHLWHVTIIKGEYSFKFQKVFFKKGSFTAN